MAEFLAAMAVIKVNYDLRGHDVLQVLVPFVADCVRERQQAVSDLIVQEDLSNRFGLPVPRTVIKTLLQRLARNGVLTREHGVFLPIAAKLDEFDLSVQLAEVQRAQTILLREGVAFAKQVFDLSVSEEELSQAIIAVVRREVIPLAVWAIRGKVFQPQEKVSDALAQVAAQYILHTISDGSAGGRIALEQIAKGGLISGTLWTTDVDAPDRHISNLEFYLDTTLLLRMLGLCGPIRQAFSMEFAKLAAGNGIKLYCFEHTRTEIIGILDAATAVIRGGRRRFYGEALEFMVSEGWTASDIEEFVASLPERLQECGVELRPRPNREARYTMDEAELGNLLDASIHYTNPAARNADIDSLASIFVLRRGRHPDRLETCRALFVTTNSNLAISTRQLYKIGEEGLRGMPLALVESQVASYLWARQAGASEQISLNLLAVGALSIAEGEPKAWLKYVDKIEELRARDRLTDRDYTLLRQSLVARSILLASTDGNADALTEDTAEFVLKHALNEHSRELEERLMMQDVELEANRAAVADANAQAAAAESKHDGALAAQTSAFAAEARRVARRWVLGLGIALSLILLFAAVISFPWPLDPPLPSVLPWWVSAIFGVVAISLGTLSLVNGLTVKGASSWMIDRLSDRLEKRYLRRFAAGVPTAGK